MMSASAAIRRCWHGLSSSSVRCCATAANAKNIPTQLSAESPTSSTHPNNVSNSSLFDIRQRKLDYCDSNNPFAVIPKAWVTTLDSIQGRKLGIIDLHPDIFRVFPRLDVLLRNIDWQKTYRNVTFRKDLSRAEMPGSGQKPWPQKGSGRARHGSRRAPQWHEGGIAHGIRGPLTYFYMLPMAERLRGLCVALTIKHAQDDLVVVNDLHLPTEDPKFLHDVAEERNWGYSALFVDIEIFSEDVKKEDIASNLVLATQDTPSFNFLSVQSLNCYSMMKHDTLVLTVRALERIEERILHHLHKPDSMLKKYVRKDYFDEHTDDEEKQFAPFI